MNKILEEIKRIIRENIQEVLPEVKPEDLEENGKIYYMNGQNGTEFDYYVNGNVSPFMVFYNDKDNMGIAKLFLSRDGSVSLYLYSEKGKNLLKTIDIQIDADKEDILRFAVMLKKQMDDKSNWDDSIDIINPNEEPTNDEIEEFKNEEEDFDEQNEMKDNLYKYAFVSRKILDNGYKVGLMRREEPLNDNDSGWEFLAGNEDDEYINNKQNIALLALSEVVQLDDDIWEYLDKPAGSEYIRISSDAFEEDHRDKEIFVDKR